MYIRLVFSCILNSCILSLPAVQAEDVRASFLFVGDLNGHHQEWLGYTKEDIGIEQQLYEIVRGKNFALNCLS